MGSLSQPLPSAVWHEAALDEVSVTASGCVPVALYLSTQIFELLIMVKCHHSSSTTEEKSTTHS